MESNEAWIHPIKVIVVKKNKSGVPRLEEVYDSENEPSDEEELRAYQATRMGEDMKKEVTWGNPLLSLHHPQPMRRTIPFLLTLLQIRFKTSQ